MKFKLNTQPQNAAPVSPRDEVQMKYNRCRANLLLVLIFTVVNLFSVTFADRYFLFSATIPMLFPLGASGLAAELETDAAAYLIVGFTIGLILTVPYLLCWIFSKKRVGWMVAALVLFSLDCLFLLVTFDLGMIADILIHAWVMFYLITGVIHGFKLKKMPVEEPMPEIPVDAPTADAFDTFNRDDFTYTVPSADKGEDDLAKDTGAAHVIRSDDDPADKE